MNKIQALSKKWQYQYQRRIKYHISILLGFIRVWKDYIQ